MSEKLAFQTEVSKLLNIVVHSLYSDKQIFLRELISNASDACDKLRYMAITKPGIAEGDGGFRIEIIPDKEKNTLEIRDNGVGMNKHDLIHELGTIARSGTQEFLDGIKNSPREDINLIGKFGVGFYSAFMVADKVEVRSRKAGEELGWLWTSDGINGFEITEAEDVKRGTSILLYLKEDQKEYAESIRIRNIVRTYSDHVAHPVILVNKGEVETINSASALWTRNKNDVTDEQYKEFYRHVSHAFDEPMITLHYKAEGAIEYTGLLFVPSQQPFNLFQPDRKTNLKLYVNRVFISDKLDDFLPGWLRFVKGVIDCKDLPLNISREMLQQNPIMTKMRNGLIRRLLDEFGKVAKDKPDDYKKFIENFGSVLKEGLYEDFERREDIASLCRFYSFAKKEYISLDDYIASMPVDQKNIYYLAGDNVDVISKNPQLEGFEARGVDVLLLSDPIDEFWPQALTSYKNKEIKSVHHVSDDLSSIPLKDNSSKEAKASEDDIKALCDKMKNIFGDEVKEVRKTERLTVSPACLTTGEGEMSIHLERLMRQHQQKALYDSSKIFEINPYHDLIGVLASNVKAKGDSDVFKDAVLLLLDQARIVEGEQVKDPSLFSKRMTSFMTKGIEL
ncbi:MAG: molecular chaperone HtpG [Alphaproteobacteria bacterium]